MINPRLQEEKAEKDFSVKEWMIPVTKSISVDSTIGEAVQFVNEFDMDFMPVIGKNGIPIGILTSKVLLKAVLETDKDTQVIQYLSTKDFYIVRSQDSMLDLCDIPFNHFLVIDNNQLIGMLSNSDLLSAISYYQSMMNTGSTSGAFDIILESAYEGIAVVNRNGIIVEFNDAYSRFIGVDKQDAIGHPVEEIIENTNLHYTVKTGMPERGAIQHIQGQAMVVHRIPLWKKGELIGAIGMLIFEGVTELYNIYSRFFSNTNNKLTEESNNNNFPALNNRTIETIIGHNIEITSLKSKTRKIAKSNVNVLITGESGTGKEMFARSIHELSSFTNGSFTSVNCGAIPEQLFESELFGYDEGAFTGAIKGGKPGKFELADNGTLFLDEIGEMPKLMQVKLLRVLQEREFERVGGVHKLSLKARIVAATNRNLKEMMKKGEFREDLYYRLNIIELNIPPLRERIDDIPLLISHYLDSLCKEYNVPKKEISGEAMRLLISYSWPGNTRELLNTLEKLVILNESQRINTYHLPEKVRTRSKLQNTITVSQLKQTKELKEKDAIQKILKDTGGNKSKAAERLGIHRTTLYQKIKKYELKI